jgi:hypothetical protein
MFGLFSLFLLVGPQDMSEASQDRLTSAAQLGSCGRGLEPEDIFDKLKCCRRFSAKRIEEEVEIMGHMPFL